MTTQTIVKKWGNSASVRLPSAVMQAARLKVDQPVAVQVEDGRITITPRLDLATLLAGITDKNMHGDIDFGPPVGKELW